MWSTWENRGQRRQRKALRDSTWKSYISSFKLFFVFCIHFNKNPIACNMNTFITFTEMLIDNGLKSKNIINILTGIKTCCTWLGCNSSAIHSRPWNWNIQSVDRTLRDPPNSQSSMRLEHLLTLTNFMQNKKK